MALQIKRMIINPLKKINQSSKKDKSHVNKSDVIYNKKTSNKSKKNNSAAVKQIKFKENIFADIHEKMTKNEVNSNDLLKVQSIALDLELFENAYLAPVVHKQIISALKMNFSTRLIWNCLKTLIWLQLFISKSSVH